ncbi:conserved protein of unknown function (plasmid) [Rhodovastum atsumiense]|uniref:Uncharacterized protein n=1 Tax=Rhodovastum atsumiense TaxID=504468 RepID=A0A5M6IN48_9PROT|nr:hypothetical protein [Rhodovastum atsumiense]KAA5609690.1 hypothetical protein F1189_23305 [Rhodovastum atsumiense]CAH2606467.1 conserved protein of unknown function [Rhodovastum atsumiense]
MYRTYDDYVGAISAEEQAALDEKEAAERLLPPDPEKNGAHWLKSDGIFYLAQWSVYADKSEWQVYDVDDVIVMSPHEAWNERWEYVAPIPEPAKPIDQQCSRYAGHCALATSFARLIHPSHKAA